MNSEEEVWQVAGRRRRRQRGGSQAEEQHRQQPEGELRRTANSQRRGSSRNSCSSSDVHGGRKSRGGTHRGGYSYKISAKHLPLERAADESREEVVRRELTKLNRLQLLLRDTALWERLVEGLGSTLAQLGLTALSGDKGVAAEASPAVAAAADSTSACCCGGAGKKADSPAVLRELVCYGIGNFSESDSSRYQLALALCLRDLLSVAGSAGDVEAETSTAAPDTESTAAAAASAGLHGRINVLVFDPVMGGTEIATLEALGCGLLQNEEGKRPCSHGGEEADGGGGDDDGESSTTPTLFFMPHCPRRLYSNVLWANWSFHGLGSIIVLGNKLTSYEDRLLDARARADPTNALLRAGPLLQDVDLLPYPASDRARWRRDVDKLPGLERAFNDLALSFSGPEARGSAEGARALGDRPLEFVEAEDGELVTGRA